MASASHADALAEHLVTLCDLHHDDDRDQQHADPIRAVDLRCEDRDDASFLVTTDSGRKFRVVVEELPNFVRAS